jgi:hypothetical protein
MAALNDISASDPAGTETPTLGDNRIRAVVAKLKEWAAIEHNLAGPHTILVGSLANRPAAGYTGRFYILTTTGLSTELQYDTGAAWVTLTSLGNITSLVANLATHIAANPVDHPTASVTSAKIADGNIKKRHLDGGTDNTSIAALVEAGSADALHGHAQYDDALTGISVTDFDAVTTYGQMVIGASLSEVLAVYTLATKLKEVKLNFSPGYITVAFTLRAFDNTGTASVTGQVYKNSATLGTTHTIAGSTTLANYGITIIETFTGIVANDLIQLYLNSSCTGDATVYVSNFKVMWGYFTETTL